MTDTAETLQYKGILRFELFTGHQMFIDRDMSKAYIEIKIDGNTNLSNETNKNDYSFGQVFHFYMKENNKKREMQILLCNVNKGGYIQKYTIVKTSLSEINLPVNEALNLVATNMIKGKKMSICYALTFLVNPFIQTINGHIEASLVSINPQKGIFQISLGTSKPLLTSTPGSMVACDNTSPYCKVVIIYWANEQFQNYLGANAIKLNKIPYTDKVEYYLCDQNWVKSSNCFKVIIDKIKLAQQCTIRLQMTIQTEDKQIESEQIVKKQQTLQQSQKMVMNITQIEIIGFPYQALANPKFIFCIETDTCNYFTCQSDLTIWKTDLIVPECRLRGKIYDSLSKNYQEELGIVDGQDVILSKQFKDYLKHYYASNPNLYSKIIDKDIKIEYEINKYKNKFTDYPYGIFEISQNNYIINNILGQGGFITNSIYDYISIKKIMGRQFIKQIDMPIYTIDFDQETIFIDDDKLKIYYEIDQQRKLINQTFNYKKSNYAKLTIKQIQIEKEFQDSIEIIILYDDQVLKTSKCRGNHFDQSFIIPFPTKLNFTILHYVEKEQMQYIQNTFQQVLNLNNLNIIDTQFINIKFISNNKDVILTVKVDLSGFIENFQNFIIKPECLVQPSMIGEYFIKVYENYRCISILNQRSSQQDSIIFDNYIYKSDSLIKPFHISLCYSSNKNLSDATILQDLQITSFDLNWHQKQQYQFDKIILHVKREIDYTRTSTSIQENKNIHPCKTFLEFIPLKVTYIQEQNYDIVIGSAFQLKHLANDSVERLTDTRNYQLNNQMFEYDRSQLDTVNIPIITEVLKQTVPFTLITLNQIGSSELNTQQARVIQGSLEPRNGIFYQELADDKGRPYLIHYATRIIKHFRYNLTQQLEVSVLQLKTIGGKSVQVNAINPSDANWITNHILPMKCEQSNDSPTFKFDDIEGSIEFIIYEEQTLYCRHIVHLQQLQFDYDIHNGKGVYALDLDGLKCTLLIKESKQQIENELKQQLSIKFIARLKTLAQRMQRYKFQLNQDKYAFEHSLKYSFLNSTVLYAQKYLNYKDKVFQEDELFEYTLAEINSEQFPIYSSVSKMHLGKKKLKILDLIETRLDDMETISQTDVTIREIQICTKNDKFDFTYTTKDGEIKTLDQAHIHYSKIYSPYTIGKFQFTFLRLIKGLLPDYKNKNVIDTTPIMIRLKYNHQVKHISNITQFGLNNDGIFKTYEFFVGNVEDTLLIQVKINNIKIAEGEVCVPSIKGKFIAPLPKIRYIHNDMIYHFHNKLNIRDLYLLGTIEFEKLNWVKVFIKLNSLDINIEEQEMIRNNYYIFVAENEKYSWTSKVFPENKKKFCIIFQENDIISQLIDDNKKDAHIKLSVKQNSHTLAERVLSLKPFIKRLGQTLDFPIKLNDQVTLNATFEISQRFRSQFYKKPNLKAKQPFDFRKQSYQQMLLLIINFQINIDEGLRELYEFIMYNLPNQYDANLIFKILISIFTSLNDKKKIATLSLQCIYSIYSSSYESLDQSVKQNIPIFLQYIIDSLNQYQPQEEKQQIISYLPDKLPAPLTNIEDIENITQQELQSYLKFNQIKAFIDIFIDNQDTLSGKNYEYILKIFDTYIYGKKERQEQLLTYVKLFYQAQLTLSQFHHQLNMAFYTFINHLIDLFRVKEIQTDELLKEPFTILEQILQDIFKYIEKYSSDEDSLLDCLFIMKQLISILKTSKKEYLNCLINTLPKSLDNFNNLQIHLGLLVEQFKGHGQNTNLEIIKTVVDQEQLELLALNVVKVEYKNVKETTTLNNLFDILIFTLEIGMEQSFSKLETFLKQNQPAQELNKISVEKFLMHLKRKEERQQRLQMLKNKQKGDQPTDINQKKKQLMEKYLITRVTWK